METLYSLFVQKFTSQSLFGLGIVIPIGSACPTARKVTAGYKGWINGESKHSIVWHDFQEFVTPPTQFDKHAVAKFLSSSLIRFSASGATNAIEAPCLILPFPRGTGNVILGEIAIAISSLFETAGFQSHLWAATVATALYGGFFGDSDPLVHQAAREARPEPGDAFPIYLNDTAGVVLLGKEKQKRVFEASLWFPDKVEGLTDGSTLLSKGVGQIEGVKATFESVFATVGFKEFGR